MNLQKAQLESEHQYPQSGLGVLTDRAIEFLRSEDLMAVESGCATEIQKNRVVRAPETNRDNPCLFVDRCQIMLHRESNKFTNSLI